MSDPVLDPEFSPPPVGAKPSGAAGRAFAWLRGHERGVVVAAVGFQLLVLSMMPLPST